MPSNTVADLEAAIENRGYTISKDYDTVKGICKIVVKHKLHDTVIRSNNTHNDVLWRAYRRALEFALAQIVEFEKLTGKNP